MEKRVNRPAHTLGGLLFGYLVRTGLACLGAAAAWFALLLVLIEAGFVLPAYSGSDAALRAMELLPAMSADHFDPDALPELCRWVLLENTVPDAAASRADVLATNMTDAQLDLALVQGTLLFNTQFYRDVQLIDGTLCRLQYDFSVPYADPALRQVLPDFQILWTVLLVLALAGMIAWSTRRTGRLLRAETARLTDACRLLAAGDLSGPVPGHSPVREFDAALRTMESLREGLAASLKAQWAMEQQRSEQIAALAHDLKSPLAIIQGNAELLAEDHLPDSQRQPVEAILRGAARAGQYLAALRAAAADELSPAPARPVDAAAFAAALAETGQALCAPPGVHFFFRNLFASGTVLMLREQVFHRAVENLLANAARFAPKGSCVTLTCRMEGSFALFAVQDEGPGFPPEILRQGGQLLSTGNTARADGHQGLGLWFARRAAESHGGSLLLSNLCTGGALAVLRLPAGD
ncbi:ATP-binding protein [uncultured Gemmiger sp.]|uniref:sensor histidine kinase n=1 Tax=uncultured Gemmiger sp. TaxID=1623490 RepID=UPI0026014CD6|nr:ATP-binding protein [uncultured Gemmiger sp.]